MEQKSTGARIKGKALNFSIDEILRDTVTAEELTDNTQRHNTIYRRSEGLTAGAGYNQFQGTISKPMYLSNT